MLGRRDVVCGMHVHVEVPRPDERVELMNRVLPYTPLLLALSASSPFWQGRQTGLAAYPNLHLVSSQPGNWDRLTAMNASSNILRQHPDLVGIYANNDGMALGVYQAVANADLASKVRVVGTDGIREAKRSIRDGEMSATVAEFPLVEGRLGVDVALRLLACQAIPPWVVSPHAVITRTNVAQYSAAVAK